jgi:hypothetical protein
MSKTGSNNNPCFIYIQGKTVGNFKSLSVAVGCEKLLSWVNTALLGLIVRRLLLLVILGMFTVLPLASALSVSCPPSVPYGQDLECKINDGNDVYQITVFADGKYIYSWNWSPRINPVFPLPLEYILPNRREALGPAMSAMPNWITASKPLNISITMVDFESKEKYTFNRTVAVKVSTKRILLEVIWGFLSLLLPFMDGFIEHKSGGDLASSIAASLLVFKGVQPVYLSIPFVYFGLTVGWNGSFGESARELATNLVVTGNLISLLLLETAFALGLIFNKYPKISFYTGIAWTAGIPLAVYFYFTSEFIWVSVVSFLLLIPVLIVIWHYSEFPYSKCGKALHRFESLFLPVNSALLVFFYVVYVSKTPAVIQLIFLATVVLFVYSSKKAFEKVEEAKKRFDEDIARIGGRIGSMKSDFASEVEV